MWSQNQYTSERMFFRFYESWRVVLLRACLMVCLYYFFIEFSGQCVSLQSAIIKCTTIIFEALQMWMWILQKSLDHSIQCYSSMLIYTNVHCKPATKLFSIPIVLYRSLALDSIRCDILCGNIFCFGTSKNRLFFGIFFSIFL